MEAGEAGLESFLERELNGVRLGDGKVPGGDQDVTEADAPSSGRMCVSFLLNEVVGAEDQGSEGVRPLWDDQFREDNGRTRSFTPGSLSRGSDEVLNCPKCTFQCEAKLKLRYHLAKVHGDSFFVCQTCEIAFYRRYDLRKHISGVHEKQRSFACNRCDSAFFLRKDLQKHVETVHERQKPFECQSCGARFGKKEHMVRHHRLVHEQRRPFACPSCKSAFGTRQNLKEHMRAKFHGDGYVVPAARPGQQTERTVPTEKEAYR